MHFTDKRYHTKMHSEARKRLRQNHLLEYKKLYDELKLIMYPGQAAGRARTALVQKYKSEYCKIMDQLRKDRVFREVDNQ